MTCEKTNSRRNKDSLFYLHPAPRLVTECIGIQATVHASSMQSSQHLFPYRFLFLFS